MSSNIILNNADCIIPSTMGIMMWVIKFGHEPIRQGHTAPSYPQIARRSWFITTERSFCRRTTYATCKRSLDLTRISMSIFRTGIDQLHIVMGLAWASLEKIALKIHAKLQLRNILKNNLCRQVPLHCEGSQ